MEGVHGAGDPAAKRWRDRCLCLAMGLRGCEWAAKAAGVLSVMGAMGLLGVLRYSRGLLWEKPWKRV